MLTLHALCRYRCRLQDVQEVAQEAVDRVDEMLGDVEEAKGIKEEIEELVEMAKGLRDADPEKQAAARTSINKAVLDVSGPAAGAGGTAGLVEGAGAGGLEGALPAGTAAA